MSRVILNASDPCEIARVFFRENPDFSNTRFAVSRFEDLRGKRYWSASYVRSACWAFLDCAFKRDASGSLIRFAPNKADVDQLLEVVVAMRTVTPIAWGRAA